MSSDEEQRLFAEILANPDDDAPRLAYAALLEKRGDPQGEFIRLDILVFRRQATNLQHERRRALVNQHESKWIAPIAPMVRFANFVRGLVGLIKLDAAAFLLHADRLFSLAPIQHADIENAKSVFTQFCDTPALSHLHSLALGENHLDDQDARTLAGSPHIRNLRWLDLSYNPIGMAGLESFAASPNIPALLCLGLQTPLVEDPISHDSVDWDGVRHENPPPASQVFIEGKYGRKQWLHPVEDPPDRYRI